MSRLLSEAEFGWGSGSRASAPTAHAHPALKLRGCGHVLLHRRGAQRARGCGRHRARAQARRRVCVVGGREQPPASARTLAPPAPPFPPRAPRLTPRPGANCGPLLYQCAVEKGRLPLTVLGLFCLSFWASNTVEARRTSHLATQLGRRAHVPGGRRAVRGGAAGGGARGGLRSRPGAARRARLCGHHVRGQRLLHDAHQLPLRRVGNAQTRGGVRGGGSFGEAGHGGCVAAQ